MALYGANGYYGPELIRGEEGNRKFEYSPYENSTYRYTMNHETRGTCLVINNDDFHRLQLDTSRRLGSTADVNNVRDTFNNLGFRVVVHWNLTCRQMIQAIQDESWRADNSSSDCFVFVLMTHGMPGNFYCGTDSQVHINDLLSDFKNGSCPDPLHGKPKLFFLQGCRGDQTDTGVETCDADPWTERHNLMPEDADKLFFYACAEDKKAFRQTTYGSWFIQVLCAVLNRHAIDRTSRTPRAGKELMWMLQRVCHIVAKEFDNAAQALPMKQMPQIVYTLTKELYFEPTNSVGVSSSSLQPSGSIESDSVSTVHSN